MLAHASKGRGVADLAIQARRVAQVSEHQRHGTNGNLFARSDHFACKEVAEDLERGHIGRSGSLVAPGGALKLKDLIRLGGIDQVKGWEERDMSLFRRPSK